MGNFTNQRVQQNGSNYEQNVFNYQSNMVGIKSPHKQLKEIS